MGDYVNQVNQNLKKIGPTYSNTAEKQNQIVQMIKRFEVEPQLKCDINMDIQGLRKKKVAFRAKPNNRRWMHSWGSFERNGMLNVGLSRNFVRLMFPTVPLFLFAYSLQPAIHGTVYNQAYNNFQWETVYHKYGANRITYVDNTITRLA